MKEKKVITMDCRKYYSLLPYRIAAEIRAIDAMGVSINEIHIVLGSGSSVSVRGKKIYLGISVSDKEIEETLESITGRALYAHRNTIKNGYVTLDGGVRVGICGQARYEGDSLVGVSSISSFLFRFPVGECNFTDILKESFQKCKSGMLIFAPPAGGKTTALRALIKELSSLKPTPKISVVDERCEFSRDDFLSSDTDIFRGYTKSEGMQIALRVMSPEIICVDEIGMLSEAELMLQSLGSGVRFIATAHAASFSELKARVNISPLINAGVFDAFVQIRETEGRFYAQIISEEET